MKRTNRVMVLALALAAGAWASTASAQEHSAQEHSAQGHSAQEHSAQGHSAAAPQADTGMSGVLRFGGLYSFGGGTDLQHGFGMDMRYQLFPDAGSDGYVGLYMQSQYELGDAWRFTGGLTGGWGMLGFDVGVAHRTATATYAGSTGLQIAQSVTLGPVSIGGRITIPLMSYVPENVASPPAVQGFEAALTVTVGFGFTAHGPRRGHGCCCPGHFMHH